MVHRVFLYTGIHPIYRTLVEYPPDEEFKVVSNVRPEYFGSDRLGVYGARRTYLRKIHRALAKLLGVPRFFFPPPGYDLIHSTRGFIPITKTPAVVDIEIGTSFVSFSLDAAYRSRWIVRRLLQKSNIRFILPHSVAAMRSFQSIYGHDFDSILRVVYPAAPILPCRSEVGSHDVFTILFVGRDAFLKGGIDLYKAVERIYEERKDIRLVMRTDPSTLPRGALQHPAVRVFGKILPYEDVLKLYCSADLFVMPTYMDSFGYVYLEAMAAGLPLIGTDQFAVPEIIEDGKNGFIIPTKMHSHDSNYLPLRSRVHLYNYKEHDRVSRVLKEKIQILMDDTGLLKKMAEHSYYLATKGKFSITYRNEQLSKIYREALGL